MKNSAKNVVKFLKNAGINVPNEFEESLSMCYVGESEREVITVKRAEAILKACKPWESYVENENEFAKLVCSKVLRMARKRAVVISSHEQNRSYIENVCKIKKELPKCMTTIATYDDARAYIRTEFGKEMRELS